jgi:uncharacterized protein (DUF1697 family)
MAMADLRGLCEDLGYEDVATYVQSGNVVLTSPAQPGKVAEELESEIPVRLGIETKVVVRTRDELADVIERDPFGVAAVEPRRYQVTFLSAEPDAAQVRKVEEGDYGDERVAFIGREIYAWHPDGMQRSKLARLLSTADFGATATARNWRTVEKLLTMADQ